MSKKKRFSVVLTLDEAARDMVQDPSSRNELRAILWSRAAEAMKVLLGTACSRFSPASLPGLLPYGVALGQSEPDLFLMCYLAAREAQEAEIAARNERIRGKGRVIWTGPLDNSTGVAVTAFRSDDPELRREVEMGHRFLCGDMTAAGSLYYLGPGKCFIEEKQEMEILAHLDRYAICVAGLEPLEV